MNSGLNPADPTLVAAFRSALLHQGAIALIAIVFLWLIWATARTWRVAPAAAEGGAASRAGGGTAAEARGRRLLRIGFGLLWIFDGILQAQPKMAGGLAAQVIEPTAAASPGVGAAPGQLGRHRLVLSPHPGRRRERLDPGRHRRLAHHRLARALVPAGRGGQRRLGPDRVDLRGVVRRDLRAGPELADRGTRRRPALRGRGRAHRAAGERLARPAARAPAAGRPGVVLPRHGAASGLAGPRFLAGHGGRQARNARRDGPVDVGHRAAARPFVPAVRLRHVRRPPWLRGQPGRGDRAGRDGRDLPDRANPAGQVRGRVRDRVLPGRLGAGAGSRLPGRPRNRPEQHDPDGPAVLGRLPGPGTRAARGHGAWRKRPQAGGGVGRDGWGAPGRRGAGRLGGGGCGLRRWGPRWRPRGPGRSRRSRRWS